MNQSKTYPFCYLCGANLYDRDLAFYARYPGDPAPALVCLQCPPKSISGTEESEKTSPVKEE